MTIYHKHHIIPKHMGGTDDPSNLVQVSVEEHAALHKQLWEDLGHWQDQVAWQFLSKQITLAEAIKIAQKQPKSDVWKKKASAAAKRRTDNQELGRKLGKSNIGRKHSEETKQSYRETRKGSKNGFYQKSHSEETKQKLSSCKSGTKWYNNGYIEKQMCVPISGWSLGRLKKCIN